jgi:hypothetical protein
MTTRPDLLARLAAQHHVSRATFHRNVQFSYMVDALAEATGLDEHEVCDCLSWGELRNKLSRRGDRVLANIARMNPDLAKDTLQQIKAAASPREAKRILYAALEVIVTNIGTRMQAVRTEGGLGAR